MNYLKNTFLFLSFTTVILSGCSSHKKLSSQREKPNSTKKTEIHTAISNSALKEKYSSLLKVDKGAIDNLQLYALIDEWYGTAYKYGGCDRNGIDCSNFVGVVYQEVYKKTIKGSSASILNQCKAIDKSELQEGDLVFFKIQNKTVSHMGLYLQNNKFVHATTKMGVMIDDLSSPYYAKYFYKAGRVH